MICVLARSLCVTCAFKFTCFPVSASFRPPRPRRARFYIDLFGDIAQEADEYQAGRAASRALCRCAHTLSIVRSCQVMR